MICVMNVILQGKHWYVVTSVLVMYFSIWLYIIMTEFPRIVVGYIHFLIPGTMNRFQLMFIPIETHVS